MDELTYKSHECIKNRTTLAIEGFETTDGDKWFLNIDNKMYRILYCPYCGKEFKRNLGVKGIYE